MEKALADANSILEKAHEGALATLEDGSPFVSAVGFVFEKREEKFGGIYMFLSDLARHTKNLKSNAQASLLVVSESPYQAIHEKKRLTLSGEVKRLEDLKAAQRLQEKYLRVFPRSKIFFELPDFRFYEFVPKEIHWIGGFGKASVIPIS